MSFETESGCKLRELQKLSQKVPHLKNLLCDDERNASMIIEHKGISYDYSHQKITLQILQELIEYAKTVNLPQKIAAMFSGEAINVTENRSVMHFALRSQENDQIPLFQEIRKVLENIKNLSETVRNGTYRLSTGKTVQTILVIGIGGSHLGVEAIHIALKSFQNSTKIPIRFIANVDPLAFHAATEDLDPATTIAVVISKTFTTAETMLNARTVRNWFENTLKRKELSSHFLAVSSAPRKCVDFGLKEENVFAIWDWVGGRFSATSAVGILPLAIAHGFEACEELLKGARSVDLHFKNAPLEKNIPVVMGLIGFWNSSVLSYPAHAIIPYCEALSRFPAHIQQVDMESNGKSVKKDGNPLKDCSAGEIVLGEPGTNAQHSFFQLIHQGRVVPVDFLGFANSVKDIKFPGETISSHDELMSNFFAQADALALGKESHDGHKNFKGDRPSQWILFETQNAFTIGQILALYEHRVSVQGFLWDINSFDQFGVQLGKELGLNVRSEIKRLREDGIHLGAASKRKKLSESASKRSKLSGSASKLLQKYISLTKT